jgi:y4mF family transcriptional regulator
MKTTADLVKDKRKQTGLSQQEFAERAGVALTVIRKIEQGKGNLNLEKVNQGLKMFGHILAPVNIKEVSREPSCREICPIRNGTRELMAFLIRFASFTQIYS